jgi:hypothetical protein
MEGPEVLRKFDPNYPKALYKSATRGDEISPAYEKIVVSDSGQAQRQREFYSYQSVLVRDAKEEKELAKDGWVDTPAKLEVT